MTHETDPKHAASHEHAHEHRTGTIDPASPEAMAFSVAVFHQGYGNGGGLWYNTNQGYAPVGGAWKGDTAVAGSNCVGSPSVVYFQNKLLVFSTGSNVWGISRLCLSAYDFSTGRWSNDAWWEGIGASPSAVVYNNLVYIFVQKKLPNYVDPTLHYMTFDGTNISAPAEVVPVAFMQNSPSAFVWGNLLWVFFQAPGNQLFFLRFNGSNWDGNIQPVPGSGGGGISMDSSASPGCAAAPTGSGPYGLYVFFKATDGALKYNIVTNNWLGESTVPDTGITDTPCPMWIYNQLFVFHQGDSANGQLWYNALTPGGSWQGDRRVPDTGMSASPSAIQNWVPRVAELAEDGSAVESPPGQT